MSAHEVLSTRALNRATLARQLLLERSDASAIEAIQRLVGLQSQEVRPPFVGLWTRLQSFQQTDLTHLLLARKVVRATAMRGTLHVMTASDFLQFRSTLQPMLTAGMEAILKDRIEGLDRNRIVQQAHAFLGGGPATFEAIRAHLAKLNPAADMRALGYATRMLLPLVVVPSKSPWAFESVSAFATAESWLGRPIDGSPYLAEIVRRFLAAYGPASVVDAQAWSGLKGLAATFELLRPDLVSFRDERRRELFDLPDAPHPPADTAAPARFLPEFDNIVLSHTDRTRIISDEYRKRVTTPNLRVPGMFLVDGFVAGTWKVDRTKKVAALIVQPFVVLSPADQQQLSEEGDRLLRFIAADVEGLEVRMCEPI